MTIFPPDDMPQKALTWKSNSRMTAGSFEPEKKIGHPAHRSLLASWNRFIFPSIFAAFIYTLAPAAFSLAALPQEISTQADETPDFSDQDLEFFEAKVRPILVKRCFECHGPDSAFEGNLSLSNRELLLEGGDTGPGMIPGDVEQSLILEAIRYEGPYEMPPDSRLPQEEIKVLEQWVKAGAAWPAGESSEHGAKPTKFDLQQRVSNHWCWEAIRCPELPSVSQEDWIRDELDAFVLAELESAGLRPNPSIDRRSWLRRVSFDLTGLPPTPEEIDSFLKDESEQAFETVVDRLLNSPHFGERWARHWLDLVRYAETYGHEFDYPIAHAWRYRDYLIRAFNADVSYDQFLLEHLAGDLLEEPRLNPETHFNESIIGTGFWFFGEATHAPVDVRGDEAGRIDNQIDVASKTFLGLTIACARCHDHKFDAISTKDYYALSGFLQSSRRQHAMLDPQSRIQNGARNLAEIRAEGSSHLEEMLSSNSQLSSEAAWYSLFQKATQNNESIDTSLESTDALFVRQFRDALKGDESLAQDHPFWVLRQLLETAETTSQSNEQSLSKTRQQLEQRVKELANWQTDSSIYFDFSQDGLDQWQDSGEAFEWLDPRAPDTQFVWDPRTAGPRLAERGIVHSGLLSNRLEGVIRSPTFTIGESRVQVLAKAENVGVFLIIDEYRMGPYNGLLFGDTFRHSVNTQGKYEWIDLAGDIKNYIGHRAHLEFVDQGEGTISIKEIRFSSVPAPAQPLPNPLAVECLDSNQTETELLNRYAKVLAGRFSEAKLSATEAQAADKMANWLLEHQLVPGLEASDSWQKLHAAHQRVGADIPRPMLVQAMVDGTEENEFVFIRGNHEVLGDEVPRRVPEVWSREWEPITSGSGRLQLAEQLLSDQNPLVRRVIVNRIWHHLFGRGIVPTVDNFGVLGQPPSNQPLLDYLATEFSESEAWSVKSMIRRIVLSQTYRMSSRETELGRELDPTNRLFHRMPVRRLQGEAIRDSMLYLSGDMDTQLFGPSVPVHLTPFMEGRGRPGRSGPLDGARRRSIYLEVRRNFLSPMMKAFDTPIPFSTMGRRNQSNVPAQALILMNDPFVHEMAKRWTHSLNEQGFESIEARIQTMYESAFARPATKVELAAAKTFLFEAIASEDPTQINDFSEDELLAQIPEEAWQDFAHVLFNVKEFTYLK